MNRLGKKNEWIWYDVNLNLRSTNRNEKHELPGGIPSILLWGYCMYGLSLLGHTSFFFSTDAGFFIFIFFWGYEAQEVKWGLLFQDEMQFRLETRLMSALFKEKKVHKRNLLKTIPHCKVWNFQLLNRGCLNFELLLKNDSPLEMSMGNSPPGYSISYPSPSCFIHPHTHHGYKTHLIPIPIRVSGLQWVPIPN
jgi:hypothetical protein